MAKKYYFPSKESKMNVDELIDLKLVHEIHTSERKSFRACRRRWDWHFRQSLYPMTTAKPLEFGVAYHVGMEVYYNPETWDWDNEVKESLAIKAFVDSCETQRQRALEQNIFFDAEIEKDYNERVELGKGMMKYYFSEVAPKEDIGWKPVKVEIAFMLPIPNPETGEDIIWCQCDLCLGKWVSQKDYDPANREYIFRGLPVVYAGRIDMLAEDKFGNYWIFDWKTAKTVSDDTVFMYLDDQVGCVPMDTEALTPTGWKTRGYLNVGDLILAYDSETKTNKWTPILDLYDYEDAELIELRDKRGSFVTKTTPNHRWIGERPSTFRASGLKFDNIIDWEPNTSKVAEYKSKATLFASAPSEVEGNLDISPDEAAFISWILTDGALNIIGTYHQASISQSWHKYADEINDLIDKLGLYKHVVESKSKLGLDHNWYTTFTFSSPEIRELWNRAGLVDKVTNLDKFVLGLSSKARKAFCKVGILAEGSGNTFCQNDGSIKEAYRLAFYLEGCRTSIGTDRKFNANLTRRPVVDIRNLNGTKIEGKHQVWCVSTRYGSWIMRQGKQITITGNSYPWALKKLGLNIQGFVYHEQRKGFPQPPHENKSRRLGCKFSVAKNQEVDYDTYVDTVSRYDPEGYQNGSYIDMLLYLKQEGPVFYARHQITKTWEELDSIETNIGLEALDIIDPNVRLYPSASRFGCKNCAFREPCMEKNSQGDYQYALDTLFEKKEHYYVRKEQGASTESSRND